MQKPPEIMRHLENAKKTGDSRSMGIVCEYVWNEFGVKKVSRLFSYDVAEDEDDIRQTFMLGVIKHIPKIDDRGNPLYHLSVRGWYAVTYLTRKAAPLAGQASLNVEEGEIQIGQLRDNAVGPEDLVVQQIGSRQQVQAILESDISPTARRACDAILSGAAGDPTELGFNKTLAKELGVSPQRSSQSIGKIRKIAKKAGVQND